MTGYKKHMGHRRRAVIAAVLTLAISAGGAEAARAPVKVSVSAALKNLNRWRHQAGEPKVTSMKKVWSHGCALHNRYEKKNAPAGGYYLTPTEVEGNPGYTTAGAAAGASSVLSTGELLPKVAWDQGVYHRVALLQPRLRVSGFSASHGYTCMDVNRGVSNAPEARTDLLELYPWPANGAVDVSRAFKGLEAPPPSDDANGDKTLGYLLSVNVNGPWNQAGCPQTNVTSASLATGKGKQVKIAISDQKSPNGAFMRGGFGIFPRAKLAAHTTYTATASGTVDASRCGTGKTYQFNTSWKFKTGG